MKKKFIVALLLMLVFTLSLTACAKPNDGSVTAVIAVPDGAPALAISEIIVNGFTYGNVNTEIDLVLSSAGAEAPSVVGTKLSGGSADFAILPTNIAVTLYKKGADIKLLSTNIWGNLFMIAKDEPITDLHSLIGETVYNLSEGGTPDILMKYFLKEAGIGYATLDDDNTDGKVILDYKPATTLIPMLKNNTAKYAILGEPAISKVIGAVGGGIQIVLDFQTKWAEITESGLSYPQASLVAKTSFLNKNKAYTDALIEKLSKVNLFFEEESNITLAKEAFILDAEATTLAQITALTVSRSGLGYKSAKEAKAAIEEYLTVLNAALPDDNFYYNL